ncbi:hypothetical protein [Onishia taeanensis]
MSDQAAGLRRWAQAREAAEDDVPDAGASNGECETAAGPQVSREAGETPGSARGAMVRGLDDALESDEVSQPVTGAQADSAPEPEPEPEPVPAIPLMVLGLPRTAGIERAQAALESWSRQGQRWVGDPAAWQVVACEAESPRLARQARLHRRWALWIDTDGDGFRQAFKVLQAVRRGGGPRRLLALHPPVASRRGLLNNLQQVAREAFDIDLLVLAP